jgi:alpha-tubulin suppressor-like RCC1 family protein
MQEWRQCLLTNVSCCCLQVVSVAASRHSLLLTADGVLFSMGPKNSAGGGGHGSKPLHASGQLGRQGGTIPAAIVMPDSALERSAAAAGSASHAIGVDPAVDAGKVKQQAPTGCLQVASGRYHSVTVTADGGVITWGLNDWGQLGREVPVSSAELTAEMAAGNAHRRSLQQQQQQQPGSSTTSSSASAATTGAPPTANRISSNATSSSSCSSGWSCHSGTPGRITALDGVRAVAAAAGRYSTMVLDDLGQIWVWGCDGCAAGQLPLQGEAWRPRKVAGALANKKVVAFDVGELRLQVVLVTVCAAWLGLVVSVGNMIVWKWGRLGCGAMTGRSGSASGRLPV